MSGQRTWQFYYAHAKDLRLLRRRNFNETGNMHSSNEQHRQLFEAIAMDAGTQAHAIVGHHVVGPAKSRSACKLTAGRRLRALSDGEPAHPVRRNQSLGRIQAVESAIG